MLKTQLKKSTETYLQKYDVSIHGKELTATILDPQFKSLH